MKGLCSNGVREAVLDLLPEFERASGVTVDIIWASTNMLMDQIAAGASGDLTILTAEAIDELIAQGKVASGSRVDLVRSEIGVAVRAGAAKPDIATAEALKAALLAAKSICYSKTGISGTYFPTVLDRLGIAAQVASKIVNPPTGVFVGTVVANGEAELGFQQISELLPVPGIDIIGPLPDAVQKVTVFSSGIFSDAGDAATARALVKALTADNMHALYREKGLTPA
jgi:molybdate transport system substrate-binding protein